ncbi:MAG: hypothetical protein ACXVPR_04785 [Actinomycetota bacterium]
MGTDPQQLWGGGMWSENSVRARRRHVFVLEERHADGKRWIELHRYPTKDEARAALHELIADGEDRACYRVQRVSG